MSSKDIHIAPVVMRTLSEQPWQSQLIRTKDKTPRALLANALIALRHAPEWKGVLAYDSFANKVVTLKDKPWGATPAAKWTDNDDRLTTEWLQLRGLHVAVEITGQAVQTVAQEFSYHPLYEWLNGLKWDGVKRLDTWLSGYLGVEDSNYARAVGARWLISAVARIFKPGCKADCCLILEGPQGIKKSTALKTLADPYFTDELDYLGSKDCGMQLQGVWLIELGELDQFGRPEISRTKAFMSRTTERFRPPYGKRVMESPRQCVFAGSVNGSTYLRDETGARRFWPVACGTINLEAIKDDRDQLVAEAVAEFREGRPWWLETTSLVQAAAIEQADRYEDDPWQEPIRQWITDKADVSSDEILRSCIGVAIDKMQQRDLNRTARCLRALGWERFNARTDRTESGREWRYRRRS